MRYLTAVFITAIAISCTGKKKDTGTSTTSDKWFKDSIVFTPIAYKAPEIDTLDAMSAPPKEMSSGEYFWRKIFRKCKMGSYVIKWDSLKYLGPGSPLNLGQIDNQEGYQRIPLDNTILTELEKNSAIPQNEGTACNLTQKTETTFNLLFSGATKVNIANNNPELEGLLKSVFEVNKKMSITIDKWFVKTIQTRVLHELLNRNIIPESMRQAYIDECRKMGNKLLIRGIYIQGFTASMDFKTRFSNELKASIESCPPVQIGEAQFKVSLDKNKERSLRITNNGGFLVFGEYASASFISK